MEQNSSKLVWRGEGRGGGELEGGVVCLVSVTVKRSGLPSCVLDGRFNLYINRHYHEFIMAL